MQADVDVLLSSLICSNVSYWSLIRYWTMWKLPMFGCNDPGQVLGEVSLAPFKIQPFQCCLTQHELS